MEQKTLKKHEKISVDIEKLAFGGAGIGHFNYDEEKNGLRLARPIVVFVENTIPGDSVVAEITRIKPNYLEARLSDIKKASPLRIEPRCKHFNICGGCTLQNLKYEDQLEIKENQVSEALSHIGGIKDPPVLPIIGFNKGAEGPWFYRNKMEFSFGKDDDGNVTLGLHPKHRSYDVFQIEECFLESSDIGEMLSAVAEFMNENNISPYNYKNDTGLLRTFFVREGKRTGERMVNIVVSDEPFLKQKEFIKLLVQSDKFKSPTSIYLTNQIVKKGHRTQLIENCIFGESHLNERMQLEGTAGASLEFEILPQSFFQTNTLQAEILYKTVIDLGGINKDDIVYDLFCGTGTIGLFCAHKASSVLGVDINESAILNARANAEKNGLKNIKFYIGDVFEVISDRVEKPNVIVVDPPRVGLGDKLCEHLLSVGAPKIVYVSCNPTTLARDLKVLCTKYKLISAQPVDMFPHTYHIETVCELAI